MVRWKKLVIALLALAPVSARAQDALSDWPRVDDPSSFDDHLALNTVGDFEKFALQHNPSLVAATARIEAARGRWVQAGRFPNPVAGYHATEIGNLGTAGQQGGFVSQRLITGGKRYLDRAIADADIRRAEINFTAAELRILADVRIRFYEVLIAQSRLELTGQLAQIADDLVAATRRLLESRQASETAFLQSEIEAQQTHILRDNARNELTELWRRLAAVIGMPGLQMTALGGDPATDIPMICWDDCFASVLATSPQLAAAHARVDRAHFEIRRARRERIPDIDVSVSLRHHNVTSDDVANVQVGIPIPVFDGNGGNIQRADANLTAAQADLRRVELELQDQLAAAYRRYANAQQQSARYRDHILTRARKTLDLVTEGYRHGQVDFVALVTAQRTYIQVNLAYLDALRELRVAFVVIDSQLLSGSLRTRPIGE